MAQPVGFRRWAIGLVSAVISGTASSVTVALSAVNIDPKDFNVHDGWHKLAAISVTLFAVPAAISLAKYLKMHPIEEAVEVATVETTTKVTPVDVNQPITETKSTTVVSAPVEPAKQ